MPTKMTLSDGNYTDALIAAFLACDSNKLIVQTWRVFK